MNQAIDIGKIPLGDLHPKFVVAMEALNAIPMEMREDNPEVDEHLVDFMAYAPPALQDLFRERLMADGLMPKPALYSDDGEPLFTTAQVAETLGESLDSVNHRARELAKKHPECFREEGSNPFHRVQ